MKGKESVILRNRECIAEYLGVTRMTLYRWEKVLRLSGYLGQQACMWSNEVDEWKEKFWAEVRRRAQVERS